MTDQLKAAQTDIDAAAKFNPAFAAMGGKSAYDYVLAQFAAHRLAVMEECAAIVDQCNREGPYNAIGAGSRIRALAGGNANG